MVTNFYIVLPSPSHALPHTLRVQPFGEQTLRFLGMELSTSRTLPVIFVRTGGGGGGDLNWSVDQQSRWWPVLNVWPVWPV